MKLNNKNVDKKQLNVIKEYAIFLNHEDSVVTQTSKNTIKSPLIPDDSRKKT